MRFRLSGKVALVFSLAALGSCSGGSTTAGVGNSPTCSGQGINSVCLEACSLGCRGNSCDISNIAQNENVVLRFSQPMDPRFVNTSTIQFRSATGDPPVGDFLVNGTIVEFVPRVLSVGGQSFFGFRSGETYTMTLPGGLGENNAVRSTASRIRSSRSARFDRPVSWSWPVL